MQIASASKGNLFAEFGWLVEKVERLDQYVKEEGDALGLRKVLCHNDVYEPNYIVTKTGDMYLIDWEYAGLNDPANDLACIFCRAHYTDIALCGFYWFCWGLYKGSVGDDDGFFFLPAYRSCVRFVDGALESYQREGEGG